MNIYIVLEPRLQKCNTVCITLILQGVSGQVWHGVVYNVVNVSVIRDWHRYWDRDWDRDLTPDFERDFAGYMNGLKKRFGRRLGLRYGQILGHRLGQGF